MTDDLLDTQHHLACRLNVHHSWRTFRTDDGERYRRCRHCGKDDPGLPSVHSMGW